MKFEPVVAKVREYYEGKVSAHGPTPQGVDWNSKESQDLRFEQLLKVCDIDQPIEINDFGCGYGALETFLRERGYVFRYFGFDISEEMIRQAEQMHELTDRCRFSSSEDSLGPADYTVASGIFNVKLETDEDDWQAYILHSLQRINEVSRKGFSFNMLTSYADQHLMRPDLYYADPLFFFDYCKRQFARKVALLHDYPLYEFTILVKKEGSN